MKRLALIAALTACATTDEPTDFDDAVADPGKADALDARHYVLTNAPFEGEPEARTLVRAGGGKLRCPNGDVAETCAVNPGDLETTPGLSTTAEVVLDEAADHAIVLRGRIVRLADGRYVMRASAATHAITTVLPYGSCYRIRPTAQPIVMRFERLDSSEVVESGHIYLDDADPTPDFWGQPTPAVQAKIDNGFRVAATRPVYVCGGFEDRGGEPWFWGGQMFVPR